MKRGARMAKIIVLYPTPADTRTFDKEYTEEHVPLALDSFGGLVKLVPTRVVGTASGEAAPYYRIAELHFRSMDDLKEAASSSTGQEAVEHALKISTGGAPLFLVAEEDEALTP